MKRIKCNKTLTLRTRSTVKKIVTYNDAMSEAGCSCWLSVEIVLDPPFTRRSSTALPSAATYAQSGALYRNTTLYNPATHLQARGMLCMHLNWPYMIVPYVNIYILFF